MWEARLALIGRQDTAEGARLAEEALRLARASNCADVEVLATAMSGLALVMNAQPDRGLALLDEAAAAALGGDVSDPYAAGLTCCYLISACDRSWSSSIAGATFLPPAVTMISFLRPTMVKKPSSSIAPRSPVWNQPSVNTALVSASLRQ